jgi:uncharacterized RDD family membrane protein YckC
VGRRLAAYFIDMLVGIGVPILITWVVGNILRSAGVLVRHDNYDPRETWVALGAAGKLAVFAGFILQTGPLYFILCHASEWQATVGKRLLRIFVSGDDGGRISTMRSAGRWCVLFLLAWFGGSLVSLVRIAASKRGKALHDFVAHTVVLNGRTSGAGWLGLWRVAAFFGIPALWVIITILTTA